MYLDKVGVAHCLGGLRLLDGTSNSFDLLEGSL